MAPKLKLAAVIALLLAAVWTPRPVPAQSVGDDSLAVLRGRIQRELGRRYYWPDRRALSGVDECQVVIRAICLSEHLAQFEIETVARRLGDPVPSFSHAPIGDDGPIELNEELEYLSKAAPDNGWEIGQLAYMNSYGTTAEHALQSIRDCRSASWWCSAVRAFVLHSYSHYRAADSLFATALSVMPGPLRCSWRDISLLLDSASRAAYTRLSCDARVRMEDRFWWLSDPLFMLVGNDRRSEHFSRRVVDSLLSGLPTPFYQMNEPSLWDDRFSDITMRFGIANHWISPGKLENPGDTRDRWIHFHTPSYQFTPVRISDAPDSLVLAEDFVLAASLNSARERYHPNYDFVTSLNHSQVVALPRGDSMLVVAALDIPREDYSETGPFIAALYLGSDQYAPGIYRSVRNADSRTLISVTVPRRNMLLGIEEMSDERGVAARTRFTLEAPGSNASYFLSQPLLFAPGSVLPRRADEAISAMYASERIVMPPRIGIYWEAGGHPDTVGPRMSLRITQTGRARRGLFGRLFGFLQSRASSRAEVSWQEPFLGPGYAGGHSIAVNIGALQEGRYELELEAMSASGIRAVARREFTLIREDPRKRDIVEVLQQPVPVESYNKTPPLAPRVRVRR